MGATLGCKALSLPKIIILASVFELVGAVFLGGFVSTTVSSGLIDLSGQVNETFVESAVSSLASPAGTTPLNFILPLHSEMWKGEFVNALMEAVPGREEYMNFLQLYMLSMVCVLYGSGAFLAIATFFSLPVSTTHAVVGSVIGNGLIIAGFRAVKWNALGFIVASWVLSPFIGALVSFFAWLIIKLCLVRVKRPRAHMLTAAPFLIAGTVGILVLFIIDKGINNVLEGFGVGIPWYISLVSSLVIAIAVGIVSATVFVPLANMRIQRYMSTSNPEQLEDEDEEDALVPRPNSTQDLDTLGTKSASSAESAFDLVNEVAVITDDSNKLHMITEKTVFNALVIVTSCAIATAHGGNDVSNSSGPLAALVYMYSERKVITTSFTPAWWCNLVTGVGIVAGVVLLGYRVMRTMGEKIVKLSPARAFVSQLSTALITLTFSVLGFPMSTTHVIVGAIYGIGFVDIATRESKFSDLKLSLVVKIVASWALTIPLAALFSGLLLLSLRLCFGL